MTESRLLDVQAYALFADGLQHKMNVGMILIGMQGKRISVLTPEFFPRQVSSCVQHFFWRRSRRHGEHELMDDFGRLSSFGGCETRLPARFIDIQIPILKKRFSNSPLKTVAIIGLKFEFSVAADIV